MIKEIQKIIISYLDLRFYKELITHDPKNYNIKEYIKLIREQCNSLYQEYHKEIYNMQQIYKSYPENEKYIANRKNLTIKNNLIYQILDNRDERAGCAT